MKKSLLKQCLSLVMLIMPFCTFAQLYEWAIVTKKIDSEKPEVSDYATMPETASNGIKYGRIRKLMQLPNQLWDWIPQRYGMCIADKKIYVYDFDADKEMIAFDFTLSAGDKFTTINGMKWVVKEASDTLVSDKNSYKEPRKRIHRLLKVETTDGKREDLWLEDFGSFSNHLMIVGLEDVEYSQTPWFLYYDESDENNWPECYIAREFSCDPFFGHDTGWMEGHYDDAQKDEPVTQLTYENGSLTFTDHSLWWPARYYKLFYRVDDDIYCCHSWEFQPHIDSGESFWATDQIFFKGLPSPVSGTYTLHKGNSDITTQITSINPKYNGLQECHDLHGRQLNGEPKRGVFIQNGKKIVWK